jgi:hypothetical protein
MEANSNENNLENQNMAYFYNLIKKTSSSCDKNNNSKQKQANTCNIFDFLLNKNYSSQEIKKTRSLY